MGSVTAFSRSNPGGVAEQLQQGVMDTGHVEAILRDAHKARREDPDSPWPHTVIELAHMIGDREKQISALQRQLVALATGRKPATAA